MKGIILAGGNATRLYPSTVAVSKHLLTVYDKPMIYYPLSLLILIGIRDILIISSKLALPLYKELLGSGEHLGIRLEYKIQEKPKGIAQAFIIGEEFIGQSEVCLILGDNLFYGQGLRQQLSALVDQSTNGGIIFSYWVKEPQHYGVVEIKPETGDVLSIEEKPAKPRSHYAITGLYLYDNSVIQKAKSIKPSSRGELEITCLNQLYLAENKLRCHILSRGVAWLDTGTHSSLHEASSFIAAIENRQGLKIACLEEVAYNCGYIDKEQLMALTDKMPRSSYSQYLIDLLSR